VPVRLFVGNLPYQASEEDVRNHFAAVAPPIRVAIPVDRDTGRPRGFAFVEYAEREKADEAIQRFNGQPFMGRNLAVNEARAREDRGPSPGGRPFTSRPPMGGPPRGDSPAAGPPERGFGGPSRRQRTSPRKNERDERGPRGPIPVKFTGRVYDVGDADEPVEEPTDFDNFATSLDEPDEDRE